MRKLFSSIDVVAINTYQEDNQCMILRDWLALDRTILANERTVLAWMRTGISVFLAGVTLIKYIADPFFRVTGFFGVVLGIMISFVGLRRYLRLRIKLGKLYESDVKLARCEKGSC